MGDRLQRNIKLVIKGISFSNWGHLLCIVLFLGFSLLGSFVIALECLFLFILVGLSSRWISGIFRFFYHLGIYDDVAMHSILSSIPISILLSGLPVTYIILLKS